MKEVAQQKRIASIALVGNPNSGKTSLFNLLTGLNQKVGNYPGITVDKKTGTCRVSRDRRIKVLDLPGLYSLYPRSHDEKIVLDILSNPESADYPDVAIVIVDSSNLKRNLLLCSQVNDLGVPVVMALNMLDSADKKGVRIDHQKLSEELDIPVFPINGRTGKGVRELKQYLAEATLPAREPCVDVTEFAGEAVNKVKAIIGTENNYLALHQLLQVRTINGLTDQEREKIHNLRDSLGLDYRALQTQDTMTRYKFLDGIARTVVELDERGDRTWTERMDKILTHRVGGYLIFFVLLFMLFQAIFRWANVPMDFIDESFAHLSFLIKQNFPEGAFTDMLAEGVVPGLAGIAIFIPQIAILFGFIAILEDSGYMARVVFLMDRLMRPLGLNGKSVVPLVSGIACAVPAIMATRNIDNWRERLITILVTPFMTCSARLPVYIILIGLVVPDVNYLGFLNLQGIVLMIMYVLGFLAAIGFGLILKYLIQRKGRSYLIMEMPMYKTPRLRNIGMTMYEKTKTFITEPGKIIFAISIVLWVLSSYGPPSDMKNVEERVRKETAGRELSNEEIDNRIKAERLESSYAAHMGKWIEPVIKPLGYDWKIGIALISSFAAREVFVSTIATIYSVGDDFEDETTIKERLRAEMTPTGEHRYNLPVAFSLLVFYAFAMQCMSTLAVVYRETKGWKWPLIQTGFMTAVAYIGALITYQILA